MKTMKKLCLIILDGFGMGKCDAGDAIFQAEKPYLDQLFHHFDQTKITSLQTFGQSVGLPQTQTGGSEAGHITIGAGRPVKQLLTVIDDQISSGVFEENEILKDLFEKAKKRNRIHFLGLVSDGGIHSYISHLFGLQEMARRYGIEKTYIHALTDGRDVGERSVLPFLEKIERKKIGTIASVGGRFFAMDRDNNWDREKQAYDVFCNADTPISSKNWREYINDFYQKSSQSDYYIPPALLEKTGQIQPEDIVIFFNFRSDRMRQIVRIFLDTDFSEFETSVKLNPQHVGIFGNYSDQAKKVYELSSEPLPDSLGEIVSTAELQQLRISETEKFNHVTYFFSGERKTPFSGEKRILIPSPKCASYEETPAMAAREQTSALMEELNKNDEFSLIVQNFANADLVGHSGNLSATKSAIEVLDECLEKELPMLQKKGFHVLVTADHGNADQMLESDGKTPAANHTKNLVPCVLLAPDGTQLPTHTTGTLADIAPTILKVLELPKPAVMTGKSLQIEVHK
jgi:2,3-bisphosphoglycerate-independent phosphoglycerate mutase